MANGFALKIDGIFVFAAEKATGYVLGHGDHTVFGRDFKKIIRLDLECAADLHGDDDSAVFIEWSCNIRFCHFNLFPFS